MPSARPLRNVPRVGSPVMSVDVVLARLDRVRGRGPRWRAICPSCGGKNTSKFVITESDDGVVLVKCFAGCTFEQIIEALGVDPADLFPRRYPDDATRQPGTNAIRKPWRASEVIAALRGELLVGMLILSDLKAGKTPSAHDRVLAGDAVERIGHFIDELSNVH